MLQLTNAFLEICQQLSQARLSVERLKEIALGPIDATAKRLLQKSFHLLLQFCFKQNTSSAFDLAYKISQIHLGDAYVPLDSDNLLAYLQLSVSLQSITHNQIDSESTRGDYCTLSYRLLESLSLADPNNQQLQARISKRFMDEMLKLLSINESNQKENFIDVKEIFKKAAEGFIITNNLQTTLQESIESLIKKVSSIARPSELFVELLQILAQINPEYVIDKLRNDSSCQKLPLASITEVAITLINTSNKPQLQVFAWEMIRKNYDAKNCSITLMLNTFFSSLHLLNIFKSQPKDILTEKTKEIFQFIISMLSHSNEQFLKLNSVESSQLKHFFAHAFQYLTQIEPKEGLNLAESLFKAAEGCKLDIKSDSSIFIQLMNWYGSKDGTPILENNALNIIKATGGLIEQSIKADHEFTLKLSMSAILKILQSDFIQERWNKNFADQLATFINFIPNKKAAFNLEDIKALLQLLVHKKLLSKLPENSKMTLASLALQQDDEKLLKDMWQELQASNFPKTQLLFEAMS